MGRRGLPSYGWIFLSALAADVVLPSRAFAADVAQMEEARILFNEGSALFQARHFDAALGLLERSFAIVPSPNTKLLIARCLRELGRRADAAQAFAETERLARKHVAQGETKYAPTADVAANEGAKLRSELGTITIRIGGSATLTVDGKPVTVSSGGDAVILHDPGVVSVEVRDASGQRQSQSVTVLAGSTVAMEFVARSSSPAATTARPPAPPTPPAPEPDRTPSPGSWTGPAALITGGVAIVGLGVFIGFGISSQNTYDNLVTRCGPAGCGPSERANADRGEREQTIANVGLTLAVVASLATAMFVVMNVSSRGGL